MVELVQQKNGYPNCGILYILWAIYYLNVSAILRGDSLTFHHHQFGGEIWRLGRYKLPRLSCPGTLKQAVF